MFILSGEDFTCVTFWPDLAKFKMETLDKDIVDLFSRRAYDIAASTRGVRVFLNGKKLPVSRWVLYETFMLMIGGKSMWNIELMTPGRTKLVSMLQVKIQYYSMSKVSKKN